jgi:hypothetical protein
MPLFIGAESTNNATAIVTWICSAKPSSGASLKHPDLRDD